MASMVSSKGMASNKSVPSNQSMTSDNSGTSNKTIGSLETWEPDDKSFSKHTFKEGTGKIKPNEGSVCTVLIIPVGKVDESY